VQRPATTEAQGEQARATNLLRQGAARRIRRRHQRPEAHARAPQPQRYEQQSQDNDRCAVGPQQLEQHAAFGLGQKFDMVTAVELGGGDEQGAGIAAEQVEVAEGERIHDSDTATTDRNTQCLGVSEVVAQAPFDLAGRTQAVAHKLTHLEVLAG
jgi:hypothetical protein